MVAHEDGSYGSSVFSRLGRASFLLSAIQQDCFGDFELSFVDYSALRVLDNVGSPYQLSPSRMAELLVRTTGGMTRIVDRLEGRGLVERVRGGRDRRSVLVGLTPEGVTISREARDAYHERRSRILTGITEDELDRMELSLGVLVEALEHDREAFDAAARPEGSVRGS